MEQRIIAENIVDSFWAFGVGRFCVVAGEFCGVCFGALEQGERGVCHYSTGY